MNDLAVHQWVRERLHNVALHTKDEGNKLQAAQLSSCQAGKRQLQ